MSKKKGSAWTRIRDKDIAVPRFASGSFNPSGFFNPPKKKSKGKKPTIRSLTTAINNQIKLRKEITKLNNDLDIERKKEKEIRQALEDW